MVIEVAEIVEFDVTSKDLTYGFGLFKEDQTMLLIAFLAFFINIVMTVGVEGVIGIFKPVKNKNKDLVPGEAA